MDAESVDSILSKDGLRLKNESEVLHSLLHWSIFECCRRELDDTVENRRLVLTSTHLIWRIRFLAAPAEDLWHDPKILSQLLSPEEMSFFLLIVGAKGQLTNYQNTFEFTYRELHNLGIIKLQQHTPPKAKHLWSNLTALIFHPKEVVLQKKFLFVWLVFSNDQNIVYCYLFLS